jgi:anthranilate synthase component 1
LTDSQSEPALSDYSFFVLPVIKEVPVPAVDPYTLYSCLGIKRGYLLESMEGLPRRAVRSIVGFEPELVISLDHGLACTESRKYSGLVSQIEGADPISMLRNLAGFFHLRESPKSCFYGGFVGYCAYDMVTEISRGRVQAGKEETPLARFMLSTRGIVYNHVQGSCYFFDTMILSPDGDEEKGYGSALKRMKKLEDALRRIPSGTHQSQVHPVNHKLPVTSSMDRYQYEDAVAKAKEHIMAGDIFQVVLSRRITCPFGGDPLRVYGAIRQINPSPYLYYLHFGDEAIIGSSPEMLVKVEERTFQTVPIAGTRPRGADPVSDDRLAHELLADEKERAEHLMLVDLARNDIGRVAEFGSVTVPEFMEIEKFSHVQHIVSRVSGSLAKGKDQFDAFASCFPAGTVSGAPKIRAMQIIAGLEAHPRGLYAGAVGYAGFNNLLEFAIAIRTLRISGGKAEFSTGAGIVADSVPAKEFDETEHKAQAMLQAVLLAGEQG